MIQTVVTLRKASLAMLWLGIALLAFAVTGCDVVKISFGNPTPTRTRTPRPTFTPRIEMTPTPEDTATPTATDTPAATSTRTRTAVVVVRPTATRPPAPPPPPQFPVTVVSSFPCPLNDPYVEIVGRINRSTGSAIFLDGYVLGLYSTDGRLLKKSDPSYPDGQQVMSLDGTNCKVAGVWPYNMKLDTAEFRGKSGFIVRLLKSEKQVAQDIPVDFSSNLRWIVNFTAPQ